MLKQSLDEYKQSNGIDLTDPVKAIQQVADQQTALNQAQGKLDTAQKNQAIAQKTFDDIKSGKVSTNSWGKMSIMERRIYASMIVIGVVSPIVGALVATPIKNMIHAKLPWTNTQTPTKPKAPTKPKTPAKSKYGGLN